MDSPLQPPSSSPSAERLVELDDGRRLRVFEVGDPDGVPIVHHHGGLSSGSETAIAHDAALTLRVRLLCPDRPGIGGSDPLPGRTLRSWGLDVEEMADVMGLGRFGVSGWSLGGCFALAVADRLGDRVTGLALIASAIPVDWPGMVREINRMDRWFMAMSRHRAGRLAERALFPMMGLLARRAPRAFARSAGFPPEAAEVLAAAVGEGMRRPTSVIAEYRILDAPWGFDVGGIDVRTRIWQGDHDDLVPADWARRLHEAIYGSALTPVPGGTHYLATDHWEAILGWLRDGGSGRTGDG